MLTSLGLNRAWVMATICMLFIRLSSRSPRFDPDLIIVAAGFDATAEDELGGCFITSACYAHITHRADDGCQCHLSKRLTTKN